MKICEGDGCRDFRSTLRLEKPKIKPWCEAYRSVEGEFVLLYTPSSSGSSSSDEGASSRSRISAISSPILAQNWLET